MSRDKETARPIKRTHEGSSQAEEDNIFKDDSHGCQMCKVIKLILLKSTRSLIGS